MKNSTEIETRKGAPAQLASDDKHNGKLVPAFVGAEKMFEKFAEITKDIAEKAFEFFRERGGEWGKEVEDWFRAENEILRPVPVEMRESDADLFVTAAVPGFKASEIEVSVNDDVLIISGKTETERKGEEASTILSEWRSNRFYRQVALPSRVLPDKVSAKLTDGMLTLTLPKAAKQEATKVAVASA